MKELAWRWILLGAALPPIFAIPLAFTLWRRRQEILGNIAGSIIIFGTAIGLILREYVEIDHVTKRCLDAGTTCWPEPSAFARFSVYAGVGLFEVIALFWLSLIVEARLRRRDYAPEWQR